MEVIGDTYQTVTKLDCMAVAGNTYQVIIEVDCMNLSYYLTLYLSLKN